ncbi:MAG: HhH-GPD family protein [Acidimicrobiales bacterium]
MSEVMLQQTQVTRVVPKWREFMGRWPTPQECAAAPAAEVVRAWAGLGYNRRALNLHRCACAVTTDHGGRLPDDLDRLVSLPGIGPYTARAVLAFAFGCDVAVVDTNVARVVSRVSGRSLRPAEAQRTADSLVPAGEGWAWNQAMLDLGATVCTPRSPACGGCPMFDRCSWRGGEGPDPWAASRQSRFAGSDRQGRGRLLDALRAGPVRVEDVPTSCGWPDDAVRADRIARAMVADGFAVFRGDAMELL